MPGAEQEIGQMAEMLGGFMTESFSGDAAFGIDETTNAESEKFSKRLLQLLKVLQVRCFHQFQQILNTQELLLFQNSF